MKPLILECFGLPGAGKTTVITSVISRLKQHNWSVADTSHLQQVVTSLSPASKAFVTARCMGINDVVNLARGLWSSRPINRETIRRAIRLPVHEAYLSLLVDTFSGEALCLDQWTVQAVWSTTVGLPKNITLGFSSFLTGAIRRRSRLFLYFDIDVHEAACRIANRTAGQSRFDGLEKREILRRLKQEEERMKYLLGVVRGTGADVLRLDGTAPVDEKVERILQWIFSQQRNRSASSVV